MKKVAIEISFDRLARILRLPADAKIGYVSEVHRDEKYVRLVVETEHGYEITQHGTVPTQPLGMLQIERLKEKL